MLQRALSLLTALPLLPVLLLASSLVPAGTARATPVQTTATGGRIVAATPAAMLDEAKLQRTRGNTDASLAVLDALLRSFPSYPPAHLERAELLLEVGRLPERALSDAKVAAEAFPDDPRAALALSLAAAETGELDLAIDALRRTLQAQSKPDAALLRRRAALLSRAGRNEEAVRAWEKLRDSFPDDPSSRVELAQLYEQVGRMASARKEHEAVLAAFPTNAPLRRRYADFLERQGRLRKAAAVRAEADRLSGVTHRKLRALPPSRN